MSDLERRLLFHMCSEDGLAEVLDAELGAILFEEPVNVALFNHIVDYWHENQSAPTTLVLETEFPGVRLPDEVEESTGWLIGYLQNRHLVNEAQDIIRQALVDLDTDPLKAIEGLQHNSSRAIEQAGKVLAGEVRPKLWSASDLKSAQQPRWLAKSRLQRGAVNLLVGDEGIGKSLLWVHLAAAVTTGKPVPEFGIPAREPQHVIVVATEDDWQTTVLPRLEIAGADIAMIRVICTDDDGSGAPVFPQDIHLIAKADPAPALVVIDAWLDTVPAKLSVRDPQQARQALHPWREVATTTDAAVLLLTHTNRVASGQARDKYGATGELRKKARLTLFAFQNDDGNLVVGPEKANGTAPTAATEFSIRGVQYFPATEDHDGTVPLLSYVGESEQTAREHIAAVHAAGHDKGRGNDEVVAWLAEFLADGPRWANDVYDAAEVAGYSKDKAKRAKRPLNVKSDKDGSGRWCWYLPKYQGRKPEPTEDETKGAEED
ncbi:AAA family ATPase [Mycolicibacterium gadium]|uniref:Uncharacterized protein n=1 Tax=Mycolicibacterium gadium TaxID=1794 RepID=A0A7I7WFM5_MYCGU|nr:AAA family ATPase [Mycolicibacterium gadium]BBZ15870.1 hypothetical protein MGAD_02050 [Mycolicibacterium gadium]